MTAIPLVSLLAFALAGFLAVVYEQRRASGHVSAALAAIGGFAFGAIRIWLIAVVIRSFILFLWQVWDLSLFVAAIPLFAVEAYLLLLLTGLETFSLGGNYTANSEWRMSARDGAARAIQLTLLTSLLFLPIFFIIAPGENGSYRASEWTSPIVRNVFSPGTTATSAEELQHAGMRAAVPDAINVSAALAALLYLLIRFSQFFRRELKKKYVYVPPKETARPLMVGGRVPRGGEPN